MWVDRGTGDDLLGIVCGAVEIVVWHVLECNEENRRSLFPPQIDPGTCLSDIPTSARSVIRM